MMIFESTTGMFDCDYFNSDERRELCGKLGNLVPMISLLLGNEVGKFGCQSCMLICQSARYLCTLSNEILLVTILI